MPSQGVPHETIALCLGKKRIDAKPMRMATKGRSTGRLAELFPHMKKEMPGGRPKYEPTEADRNTVRSMASQGVPHETIALCLGKKGIDAKTMRKHFRRELDTAAAIANAIIGTKVYNAAMRGEAWACCFWLKSRAGWNELTGSSSDRAERGKTVQRVVVPAGRPLPAAKRRHRQAAGRRLTQEGSPAQTQKGPPSLSRAGKRNGSDSNATG
jgi:hypothetical protein